jgi:hypothetical protein
VSSDASTKTPGHASLARLIGGTHLVNVIGGAGCDGGDFDRRLIETHAVAGWAGAPPSAVVASVVEGAPAFRCERGIEPEVSVRGSSDVRVPATR